MKPRQLKAMILLVCGVLFAAHTGQAFYNPSTGRWLSRDPIEENDGPALYASLRNDCVTRIDLLGLEWIIERRGLPRAEARATSADDTFAGLARLLAFDTSDYKKWARTTDDKPAPCKIYSIPNTVFFDMGYHSWYEEIPSAFIGFMRTHTRGLKHAGTAMGFYTPWTENVSADQIIRHLRSPDIFGYVFVGHGAGGGVINAEGDDGANAVSMGRYTRHGIRFLELYACGSADKGAGRGFDYNWWEANVATRGWFLGFDGLVHGYDWPWRVRRAPGKNVDP